MSKPIRIIGWIPENIRAQKIVGQPGHVINFQRIRVYFSVITSDEKMNEFIFNKISAYIGPVMGMGLPEKRAGKSQLLRQAP